MKEKNLIGQLITRVFILCWPPFGEEDDKNIDISIGLKLQHDNCLRVISTDSSDNWTPSFSLYELPTNYFHYSDFEGRLSKWKNCLLTEIEGVEYFNFSESSIFQSIVNKKILDVELISVEDKSPFGVKLTFENDFIVSTPISDGNTIETAKFHTTNNIKLFEAFGELKYTSLK